MDVKEDTQNIVTKVEGKNEYEVFSKQSNRNYRVWFGIVEELDGALDDHETVGSWHCTCQAGTFGKKCKHVKSVLTLFPQEEEGYPRDQL